MGLGFTLLVCITLHVFTVGYAIDPSESNDKWDDCRDSCRGPGPEDDLDFGFEHMRNGTLICLPNLFHSFSAVTPCFQKCVGIEVPEQGQCWCDHCKNGNNMDFCEKPFGNPIGEDDCENLVCSGNSGKIKYFGDFCTGDDPERIGLAQNKGK